MTDQDKIQDVVEDVAAYYKVNLTSDQVAQVSKLMSQIGQQDYDYNAIKGTMEGLQDKLVDNIDGVKESFLEKTDGGSGIFAAIGSFFAGIFKAIGDFFSGLFGGGDKDKSEDSILDNVDDSALGITGTDDPNAKGVQTTEAPEGNDSSSAAPEETSAATDEAGVKEDSFTVDKDANKAEKSEGDSGIDTSVSESTQSGNIDIQ